MQFGEELLLVFEFKLFRSSKWQEEVGESVDAGGSGFRRAHGYLVGLRAKYGLVCAGVEGAVSVRGLPVHTEDECLSTHLIVEAVPFLRMTSLCSVKGTILERG